ncbi:MAG: hypothetical protein AAF235_03755, partial [Planctomycetota bacterium]
APHSAGLTVLQMVQWWVRRSVVDSVAHWAYRSAQNSAALMVLRMALKSVRRSVADSVGC